MASKNQMTGMLGVYLVAAELSKRNFIVSVTSRSAAGADLLVTDQTCSKAWSVQVKTNSKPTNCWLVNPNAANLSQESHMYVFVNIGNSRHPDEFIVVPSKHVSERVQKKVRSTGSSFYWFNRSDRPKPDGGWEQFEKAK